MQLQQGFRQTVPVRSFARDDELAVQYAWLFVIELRNAQRKQSGFAVVILTPRAAGERYLGGRLRKLTSANCASGLND